MLIQDNNSILICYLLLRKKIGWIDQQQLEYALFGTVLGEDHRPFKTRSGDTVALLPLIDQAIEKAKSLIIKKHPNWAKAQLNQTAQSLAISAIKYADLSNDKIKNYLFSEEKMLAFDGNTAPYLLNAYVRIQASFEKQIAMCLQQVNGQLDLSTEGRNTTRTSPVLSSLLKLKPSLNI